MPVNRGTIFRVFLAVALLIPALISQTVLPVIEESWWENFNESMYEILMAPRKPHLPPKKGYPDSDERKPPKVVIIEAGSKSRHVLGDPIPRRSFMELLGLLKESGNPWILSRLSFPKIAPPPPQRRLRRDERRQYQEQVMLDQLWVDTLKYYRHYISAAVHRNPEKVKELSSQDLGVLNPKLMLSNQPSTPSLSDMPFHAVQVGEPLPYLEASGAIGLMNFQDQAFQPCMPLYVAENAEYFVLPYATLWAYAYGSESGLSTWKGARWPRKVGQQPFAFRRHSKIAPLHCLGSPSVSLSVFMKTRRIETLELSDVLEKGREADNKKKQTIKDWVENRVVILTSDRLSDLYDSSTGLKNRPMENTELARFLDDLMTQSSVRRYPHFSWEILHWLPLILAFIILIPGLFITMTQTLFLMLFLFLLLLGFSLIQLQMQQLFLIPSQGLIFMGISISFYFVIMMLIGLYAKKRVDQFQKILRNRLSQCLDLEELKLATQSVCAPYFSIFKIFFLGTDDQLHEAAASFAGARDYINRVVKEHSDLEKGLNHSGGEFDQRRTMFQTVLTTMKRVPSRNFRAVGERNLNARIAISSPENVRLGTLDLQLNYYTYEDSYIVRIVSILQEEVSLNWSRLELQARKKLREFHEITQEVSRDVLNRFLSPPLLRKIKPDLTMEQNLRTILSPGPVEMVMIQADIRGFTNPSGDKTAQTVVETMQKYYRNVVESARKIAQIRLLGDSIFIFIEQNVSPREGVSSTDLALQLAGSLVRETEKQNEADTESMPVNFGIAIHTGEVIAGNLTSGGTADYTLIGQNVNLVEKIEQLTRIPKVHQKIGTNGILLTPEARKSLRYFSETEISELNLEEIDLSVRSFPLIKKLHYITRQEAINLANRVTITRMINPSLPLE